MAAEKNSRPYMAILGRHLNAKKKRKRRRKLNLQDPNPKKQATTGQAVRKNAVGVQATATATSTPMSKPDAYITRPVHAQTLLEYLHMHPT